MKDANTEWRTKRAQKISPHRNAQRIDRRQHERATAVSKFEAWDREMTRQHGRLYYRAMGWTVH